MTRKVSDMWDGARKLEAVIAAKVERTARQVAGSSPVREPLEVALAIVEAVEQEIQPTGRGRRAFPFNQIKVALLAVSTRERAHLELVCEGPPSLQQRIADRLRAAGCPAPDLSVKVSFVAKARPDWSEPEFHVAYVRDASPTETTADPGPRLELTVTHGTTGQLSYTFAKEMVAIGRGADVRDTRQRLIRVNQLAFTEGGGEINHSVSRRHARIEHDAVSGAYRVFDDGSAQGTSVIRRGRGIEVPRGTKGVILQSGDELVLGEARVKVQVHTSATPTIPTSA
jgi:hypothetical protein